MQKYVLILLMVIWRSATELYHELYHDMVVLSKEFVSCKFCWIKRDANFVAHSLAKFASCNKLTFSCNISSLPPSVWEAWKGDGFPTSV